MAVISSNKKVCHARTNRRGFAYCDVCGLEWDLVNPKPDCLAPGVNGSLSLQERHLYWKMMDGAEAPIRILYRALTKQWPPPTMQIREQQQFIGPYIARLNAKLRLRGMQAAPGIARNSYRIIKIVT